VTALKRELPEALKRLQDASIAPVDLAQSAIGPGMAVFSRYAQVLEPDGTPMAVRTALGLINQVLDEVLAAEESEYDADTRWAITWFTQHGFDAAPYGEAETLSKARNTSVEGLVKAGILEARGGKVRLLRRDELGDAWTPSADARFTVWEACQHLIKALETGGEAAAADLLRRLGPSSSPARELAYRLYQHCERTQQAEEARSYNGLVVAWPRLAALATERAAPERLELDFGD
jgi:putative DNA methylase